MIRLGFTLAFFALLLPWLFYDPATPVISPLQPSLSYSAWLPYWDQNRVIESLELASPQLQSISPLWYHLNSSGVLEPFPLDFKPIIELASASNLKITPLIGNELDGDRAVQFLDHPELWAESIAYLITQAEKYGFAGYDLDFEAFPPAYGLKYFQFIHQTQAALTPIGYTVSVSVPAFTSKTAKASHPYQKLADIGVTIRLMAYDYHYSGSAAGPITPISWLKEVLSYATSNVPLRQLELGLPLYGYDWLQTQATSITFYDAKTLLIQNSLTPVRDPASQALSFTYTATDGDHQVYYEDVNSLNAKINLGIDHGLTQFIFWRLGGEDPNLWPNLTRFSPNQ